MDPNRTLSSDIEITLVQFSMSADTPCRRRPRRSMSLAAEGVGAAVRATAIHAIGMTSIGPWPGQTSRRLPFATASSAQKWLSTRRTSGVPGMPMSGSSTTSMLSAATCSWSRPMPPDRPWSRTTRPWLTQGCCAVNSRASRSCWCGSARWRSSAMPSRGPSLEQPRPFRSVPS